LQGVNITELDRRTKRNCDRTHGKLLSIIHDRRNGKVEGWTEDSVDLLSVLMRTPEYKTDEALMVDEICTMFVAGSKTVQVTTSNLIMYL
jgi:cytochrome P450